MASAGEFFLQADRTDRLFCLLSGAAARSLRQEHLVSQAREKQICLGMAYVIITSVTKNVLISLYVEQNVVLCVLCILLKAVYLILYVHLVHFKPLLKMFCSSFCSCFIMLDFFPDQIREIQLCVITKTQSTETLNVFLFF